MRLFKYMFLAAAFLQCCEVKSESMASLPEDAVVISVNGRATTKRDFNAYVKMNEALYRNKFKSAQGEKFRGIKIKIRVMARKELLVRSLQQVYICTNANITATKEQMREMEHKYSSFFCRRGQSFEDLIDVLRSEGAEHMFRRCFEEDLKVDAALRQAYPGRLDVSAEDISNAVIRVKEYNAIATATNALICALATNVLSKIKAGGDFAEMADRFSMDPNKMQGGDLGECTLQSFGEEGEDLLAAAAALKPGDVSGIVDGETGYIILKKTGESSYSQIFFRKPYFMEMLSGDALVEELKKEKRTALMEEVLSKAAKTAKIEYPHGDVFMKFNQQQNGKPPKRRKKK